MTVSDLLHRPAEYYVWAGLWWMSGAQPGAYDRRRRALDCATVCALGALAGEAQDRANPAPGTTALRGG